MQTAREIAVSESPATVAKTSEPKKAKKAVKYAKSLNPLTVKEAIEQFGSLAEATGKIQLLRPFIVMPLTSYSNPLVLPLGVAYLASLMREAGYEVDLIDSVGEAPQKLEDAEDGRVRRQGLSPDDIIGRIDPKTKVLGISLMFSQEWVEHRRLIDRIGEAYPDMTIVVGGEHATALPEFVLRQCPAIDYVVQGEGELIFLELASRILRDDAPESVQGISYLDADGAYVDTGLGRRIADFPSLPRPAWDLCNVTSYFSKAFSFGVSYGRNMPILATRGCPYQCTFCSNPTMWTTRYMMREPADVVDEIEDLMKTYGCNSVDFADLTAIVKKDWILAFCGEIQRRKLDIVWQLPTGTRAEALDQETLTALYESGCRLVVYAPESGSEETLKLIKKKLKLDNVLASAATAAKIGHMTKVNFILGFPGETRKSMLASVWACIRMAARGVGDTNVVVFSPYPGSQLFNELVTNGEIDIHDDEYFYGLTAFFDFTNTKNYNGNVPSWQIGLIRFSGMSLFYLISYLLYPRRLLRLVEAARSKDFQPNSLFEQRIFDAVTRHARRRKPA